ncbi:DUF1569 domain-containing protein [Flavobacterium sp.]|jgi:hypothetical protein|uniref:DUF1569 domain-containing protein n=1 Tax=Flavobacterium sp. TaxID=239 RepID=UPI0037C04E23
MNPLLPLLQQLESHISNFEKTNPKVSNSTVGWQIDHCLLVINGIIGQLEISDPLKYQPKWTFPKFMVFTTGKIPRGKAQAPKVVIPNQVATQEELLSKIAAAKNNVLKLDSFSENQFFNHPYFKDLNVKQTKKFLTIHTKHHLKIIEDILK